MVIGCKFALQMVSLFWKIAFHIVLIVCIG
jgi:hypothetical protein